MILRNIIFDEKGLYYKMKSIFNYVKGLLYCYCWAASIIAGYIALFCPILPLLFITNKYYRLCTDVIFTFWQIYPTSLLQFLCGCRVHVTGDPIVPGLTSLLVMNHRTRTDWNFLWPAVYHATCDGSLSGDRLGHSYRCIHPLKFVLKDAIRHIPGPGWVMQLACFVYIKRIWNSDKYRLEKLVDYFTRLKYKYTLVLFPEGTDLTEQTQNSSNRHAEKYNLPKYEYVLHPRTKGFTYLASDLLELKALDCIYDVTLLYPDNIPQTERDLIRGNFPKVVRMHFKRYNKDSIPSSDSELKLFLEHLWIKKEQYLKDHYENGNFLTGPTLERRSFEIYAALVFWSFLPPLTFFMLYFSSVLQFFVFSHTFLLITVNVFNGGFQNFEIDLYNFKKRFFCNPW